MLFKFSFLHGLIPSARSLILGAPIPAFSWCLIMHKRDTFKIKPFLLLSFCMNISASPLPSSPMAPWAALPCLRSLHLHIPGKQTSQLCTSQPVPGQQSPTAMPSTAGTTTSAAQIALHPHGRILTPPPPSWHQPSQDRQLFQCKQGITGRRNLPPPQSRVATHQTGATLAQIKRSRSPGWVFRLQP